ncbi:MAG: hypothetical protein KY469_14960 [Actinobacteria bacterium]|nr:hypothetical protein [Actinomycetota bacterium]
MTSRWIVYLVLAFAAFASLAFTPTDDVRAAAQLDVRFDDRIGVGACAKAHVMWVKVDRTCVWVGWPPG